MAEVQVATELKGLVAKIKAADGVLKTSGKANIEKAKEVGKLLLVAKNKVMANKGLLNTSWAKWVEEHAGYTQQHAGNFIRIYERWEFIAPTLNGMRGISDALKACREAGKAGGDGEGEGNSSRKRKVKLDKLATVNAIAALKLRGMTCDKLQAIFHQMDILIVWESSEPAARKEDDKPQADGEAA